MDSNRQASNVGSSIRLGFLSRNSYSSARFGSKPGDQNWNTVADVDKSGFIDILDIFKIAWDFGKTV
jgi:hypothetical protein